MTGTSLPGRRDTAAMRILPVQNGRLLVELQSLDAALGLFDALERDRIDGVVDLVPAARSVMVSFDPAVLDRESLVSYLSGIEGAITGTVGTSKDAVEIPVRYDGPDLAEVATLTRLSAEEVIRRHCASDYVVAFTGFAPGFAYLTGGDPALHVPRRLSPRTQVPAGAVGLAGEFSGVYPKASPGGWQLIGSTPLDMFDIDRVPASLVRPGGRVRFRNMAEAAAYEIMGSVEKMPATHLKPAARPADASLQVVAVGLPVLFQDLGRANRSSEGISMSGAADRASLKRANRLVGNPQDSAALEIALGGLRLRAHGASVIAIAGAELPLAVLTPSGRRIAVACGTALALDDGDEVVLGAPSAGFRSYLAVRGGFDIARVLGSASTDTLAGIGPDPIAIGDVLSIRKPSVGSMTSIEPPIPGLPASGDVVCLDVVMGPRTDWFTEAAVDAFLCQEWSVTSQSSRVGIRLDGKPLERAVLSELPSEATVRGALQVPPSGQPVLFLADHPVTGGYPVIACVAEHHLDLAGQVPVGARLRFRSLEQFSPIAIPGKSS